MIKKADINNIDIVVELALELWPDNDKMELKREMEKLIEGKNSAIFLYNIDNKYVGFSQVGLRIDYVEGTSSSPVGYLEGIYVRENYRKNKIGTELLKAGEEWAKEKNMIEFASDCEMDNIDSYNFHMKLGFIEANKIICFKKDL